MNIGGGRAHKRSGEQHTVAIEKHVDGWERKKDVKGGPGGEQMREGALESLCQGIPKTWKRAGLEGFP